MSRWKLTIEYKGTNYSGWQIQPDVSTVQGQIMLVLEKLFNYSIVLYGAGRTDSGVHARGQVAHFDLKKDCKIGSNLTELKMRKALNFFLFDENIVITKAEKVNEEFDARFSATQRTYLYRISNRWDKLVFNNELVWHTGGKPLDASLMQKGADYLVGTYDFTTFRAMDATHQKPLRTLDYLNVQDKHDEIHINVGAKSFLHNQVRYIVGALQLVGYSKRKPEWIKDILNEKDRRKGGPLAPAHGLILTSVKY